eukprot:1142859-Pelagomonas_calceolata.AAC.6
MSQKQGPELLKHYKKRASKVGARAGLNESSTSHFKKQVSMAQAPAGPVQHTCVLMSSMMEP